MDSARPEKEFRANWLVSPQNARVRARRVRVATVSQPFRNREEERDAGKKITILRILRSMETKRTKKNETCHRVNRFRRKKNDTETQLVYGDTRGTCN